MLSVHHLKVCKKKTKNKTLHTLCCCQSSLSALHSPPRQRRYKQFISGGKVTFVVWFLLGRCLLQVSLPNAAWMLRHTHTHSEPKQSTHFLMPTNTPCARSLVHSRVLFPPCSNTHGSTYTNRPTPPPLGDEQHLLIHPSVPAPGVAAGFLLAAAPQCHRVCLSVTRY